MTAVAGTAEYAREYQRRRGLGLPTRGLAAEMREGNVVPAVSPAKLAQAQRMYARGAGTSEVMAAAGLTYAQCQLIRSGMED